VQNQQAEVRRIKADAPTDNVWTKVTRKSITRQPKPRSDAIIIEPNEKMSYAEILNLVTRNQSDKLKDVGESVRRVKRTAKYWSLIALRWSLPSR